MPLNRSTALPTPAYLHKLLRDPGLIAVSSTILMKCYIASDQYVITLNLTKHNLDPQAGMSSWAKNSLVFLNYSYIPSV